MAPKFGTSGLRGLVTELTPDLVADHVRAFLAACPHGGAVHVGRDLRASSPDIAGVVVDTLCAEGVDAVDCGAVPTPALALEAMGQGHGAIMITGSHIPADRNGLKFYVPTGEIGKADEAAILNNLGRAASTGTPGARSGSTGTAEAYTARYVNAFGPDALAGLRIGIYEHSSVARDLMQDVVSALGAVAVPLARADRFIPVDTEAVSDDIRARIADWCSEHALDALISTDGDADRPLMADDTGVVVPGDVLGALTARSLGARVIATPVSSNSMIGQMTDFDHIARTRIGSPFVIAAMEAALAKDPGARVVGYEANGGFLLGFAADLPGGRITPLPTRDCMLPILAPLWAAQASGRSLAQLVADLPPVHTAADRVAGVPSEASRALIETLSQDEAARADFFLVDGKELSIDRTDGLRVTFQTGQVVHLRPSGNAPECRCYAEAETAADARNLVSRHLAVLAKRLGA